MSFLSMIFGCEEKSPQPQNVFPVEKFFIIKANISNKPVIGSFNSGYKEYSLKNKYPWCLKIMIALNEENLFENELPKSEESLIANKLEDELLEKIKSITTAHYIGHLFNDSFLDIYIYLEEPEKAHQYLQTQVNKVGLIRSFAYEINEDPKWSKVSIFIDRKN